MTDVVFEFYRGDTYERDFKISNLKREITKVYFTVKETEECKNACLQKSLNNGIVVVDEDETSKTFNLLINATDTDNMKVNTAYSFDIEIHCGDIKKTIVTGTLMLKPSCTRTCNEC